MVGRMPVLREIYSEWEGSCGCEMIDNRDDVMGVGNGECTGGQEVILDINDDQSTVWCRCWHFGDEADFPNHDGLDDLPNLKEREDKVV